MEFVRTVHEMFQRLVCNECSPCDSVHRAPFRVRCPIRREQEQVPSSMEFQTWTVTSFLMPGSDDVVADVIVGAADISGPFPYSSQIVVVAESC